MTLDEIQLAAHQLGMYKADVGTAEGLAAWRDHNKRAAELRARVGVTYQPYAHPNKALVKALYTSLREGLISRAEFAACLPNVMGRYRL